MKNNESYSDVTIGLSERGFEGNPLKKGVQGDVSPDSLSTGSLNLRIFFIKKSLGTL